MRAKGGFTLLEFLVVVLIFAALVAIAVPRISKASTAAKANACAASIDLINAQIELYYQNTGSWPSDLEVVTKDSTYFSGGEPKCPITNSTYPKTLTADHRVDTSGHAH
jgi:prepilin-type N-terminal cleavage/methylation domain-containing protein